METVAPAVDLSPHPPEWRSLSVPWLPAGLSAWTSDSDHDPAWDAFLLGSPLGQFQQSAAWARVKRIEGWRAARVIVTAADRPAGGFQILWRSRFRRKLGFINKGPVMAAGGGVDLRHALELAKTAAARLGLTALVIQPPDLAEGADAAMSEAGLLDNRLTGVISATILIELARPWEAVERDFSHNVRYDVRKIRDAGVETGFEGPEGAERFFALMCASCARQGVAPNPPDPASIQAILTTFQAADARPMDPAAKLLVARRAGQVIAGLLLLRFGSRLSVWKKGAAAVAGGLQPTKLLEVEAIRWGHATGCRHYDMVGIDRATAEELRRGRSRGEIRMKSSDQYKLLFGGRPVVLPESRIWVPGLVPRWGYRALLAFRRRRRRAEPDGHGQHS